MAIFRLLREERIFYITVQVYYYIATILRTIRDLDLCTPRSYGLCDELITCPEESYRPWRVVVCDLEIS
jgi:hypothetical protein